MKTVDLGEMTILGQGDHGLGFRFGGRGRTAIGIVTDIGAAAAGGITAKRVITI